MFWPYSVGVNVIKRLHKNKSIACDVSTHSVQARARSSTIKRTIKHEQAHDQARSSARSSKRAIRIVKPLWLNDRDCFGLGLSLSLLICYWNYYDSEGGSVGLWLSPYMDIEFIHSIAFDSSARSRGCWNSFALFPMDSFFSLRVRHSCLMLGKSWCTEEIDIEPTYLYNWTALPSQFCDVFV